MSDESLRRAQAALRSGDAAGAREGVVEVVRDDPGRAEAIEILARADYLDLAFGAAIEGWERAYAAYRAAGDRIGAIRVARTLSGMYFSVLGEFAVSSGWLARAQTLLDGAGLEGADEIAERGWVALNLAIFEPDRATKNQRYRDALTAARAAGDPALEVAALAYLGASLVHAGGRAEGMQLLDEALAAIAGDEVDDFFVLEEVFCQLFSACERARDVARAEQWIRVGEAIAARRNLPAVTAFCRTHYGGVLTAAGRWGEADETLTDAVRLWDIGRRSSVLRGGALVRLADLRVRQGRFEEAEALLTDLDPVAANEAARPRAAVQLARGELEVAEDILEAALDQGSDGSDDVALLDLLIEVLIARGRPAEAAARLEQLERAVEASDSSYERALAAMARGRVCMATGHGDPRSCLREALTEFSRAQVPLETARARLELARALAAERPAAALVEARAALEAFERLKAARYADAAAALMRSLGVRPSTGRAAGSTDGLTARETEVLELLGAGLSNPEIAERLFISRKTVEHHVGNVLAKLGLRSRAEAAAHAVQRTATPSREPAQE